MRALEVVEVVRVVGVMSEHQTGPRCRRILTKKTHTHFQAAIFLYFATHNALGLDLHRQPSYKHTRVGVVRVVEVVEVLGVVGVSEIHLSTGLYTYDTPASFNLLLSKMYKFLCAGKSDAAALYLSSKTRKSALSEVLQPGRVAQIHAINSQ